MTNQWTDEEIERLRSLARGSGSAGEIGKELGKTRNAVIGKMRRLGLALPAAIGPIGSWKERRIVQRNPSYKPARKPPAERPLQAVETVEVPKVPPAPASLPRATATAPATGFFRNCQWIFGDPKGEWSKCNSPAYGNSAYCEHHYHRVYVPRETKGALPR